MGLPEVGDGPKRQTRRGDWRKGEREEERKGKGVVLFGGKERCEGRSEEEEALIECWSTARGEGSEARERSSERRDSVRILYTRIHRYTSDELRASP